MSASSRNLRAINEPVLLRAAGEATYARLAVAINHDASYITRFFQDQQKISLSEVLMLLDVCGLTLTRDDPENQTIPTAELEALRLFALKGMQASYTAGALLKEVA